MPARTRAPQRTHTPASIEALAETGGLALLIEDGDRGLAWASSAALGLLGCSGLGELRQRWNAQDPAAMLRSGSGLVWSPLVELEPQGRRGRFLVPPAQPQEPDQADRGEALAQARLLASCLRVPLHDLRSPLNVIALNLELLRRTLGPEASADRPGTPGPPIAAIASSIARLDEGLYWMRKQLKLDSEAGPGSDLREALQQVADLVEPTCRHAGVTLQVGPAPEPLAVAADPPQLRLCLAELVLLQLQATPRGAALHLEARAERGRVLLRMSRVSSGSDGAPAEAQDATEGSPEQRAAALGRRLRRQLGAELEFDAAAGRCSLALPPARPRA